MAVEVTATVAAEMGLMMGAWEVGVAKALEAVVMVRAEVAMGRVAVVRATVVAVRATVVVVRAMAGAEMEGRMATQAATTVAAAVTSAAQVAPMVWWPDQSSGAESDQACTTRWRYCACSAGRHHSTRRSPCGARMPCRTQMGCCQSCRTNALG